MSANYANRLEKVRLNLDELGLSQMLVSDPMSICWLTGFYVDPSFCGPIMSRCSW